MTGIEAGMLVAWHNAHNALQWGHVEASRGELMICERQGVPAKGDPRLSDVVAFGFTHAELHASARAHLPCARCDANRAWWTNHAPCAGCGERL